VGSPAFFYLCRQSLIYLCRVSVVTSRREFSPQTLSVLAVLYEQPSSWQHGYALASETGLKSGTLYPILIRLADRGLVEACWQEEPQPGRPRRHLYRLTADGLASATGALAAPAQQPARRAAASAAARRPIRRGAPAPTAS
jgi:PadR family transcriptional regulator, regulatory protein PadR